MGGLIYLLLELKVGCEVESKNIFFFYVNCKNYVESIWNGVLVSLGEILRVGKLEEDYFL